MKFVDPKNDVAFKKIFGNENKKGILMSFLNNILEFAGTDREIMEISIENPFQLPKLDGFKYTILDIKAQDRRGIHYIIEMQVIHTEAFEKKVMYYVSKAYSQQLEKAEDYPKLNQVIFLGFLDFTLFADSPDYFSRHLILNEKTNHNHFTDFALNFVELPKFTKELDQLKDLKDKWIYFVKNASDLTMVPETMKESKEIQEAFEIADKFSWTPEELDAYDAKGIFIADERQRIIYARKEGEQIGREKGKEEKAMEIAKAMVKTGIDIEIICQTTGLTKEEIPGL